MFLIFNNDSFTSDSRSRFNFATNQLGNMQVGRWQMAGMLCAYHYTPRFKNTCSIHNYNRAILSEFFFFVCPQSSKEERVSYDSRCEMAIQLLTTYYPPTGLSARRFLARASMTGGEESPAAQKGCYCPDCLRSTNFLPEGGHLDRLCQDYGAGAS